MGNMDIVGFGKDDIQNVLAKLSPQEIDQLAFGAVQIDGKGTVLQYNAAESGITGRAKKDVIGKNFFRDVAPCTRVQRFFGAFQTGVERRALNEVFDFTFRFPTGARDVRIRMIYSNTAVWIFVTPIG